MKPGGKVCRCVTLQQYDRLQKRVRERCSDDVFWEQQSTGVEVPGAQLQTHNEVQVSPWGKRSVHSTREEHCELGQQARESKCNNTKTDSSLTMGIKLGYTTASEIQTKERDTLKTQMYCIICSWLIFNCSTLLKNQWKNCILKCVC